MKPSKKVPSGPRIVTVEEYKAHGLDQDPATAFHSFSSTFVALRHRLLTPEPPVFRCSFTDSAGRVRSLGDHSGTLQEIANKMRMHDYNEDAIYHPETGQIFIHVFSTTKGEKMFPVVMEEVNEHGASFSNMNLDPLPFCPRSSDSCGRPLSSASNSPDTEVPADVKPLAEILPVVTPALRPEQVAKLEKLQKTLKTGAVAAVVPVVVERPELERGQAGVWRRVEPAPTFLEKHLQLFFPGGMVDMLLEGAAA